ncbi:MAG: hypothetical protein NTU98_14230 [Bacteroidetes bacterium]|nr:hypothetical protein [Bacteroidota bacterium]
MKKSLLIFLLPAFFASTAYSQAVTFFKENMQMKLDAEHVTVTGEYHFRNNYNANFTQTVFFPLPLAPEGLKYDSVAIFDASEQTCITHYRKMPAGLFFQLTLHPQEAKTVRLYYVMDHDGRNVRYLVMTHVQYWHKSLAFGNYTLQITDPSIVIDSVSYKPDEVKSDNNVTTHNWKKVNFNPDKELDIWFHIKK